MKNGACRSDSQGLVYAIKWLLLCEEPWEACALILIRVGSEEMWGLHYTYRGNFLLIITKSLFTVIALLKKQAKICIKLEGSADLSVHWVHFYCRAQTGYNSSILFNSGASAVSQQSDHCWAVDEAQPQRGFSQRCFEWLHVFSSQFSHEEWSCALHR